jgi:hypothetical protein
MFPTGNSRGSGRWIALGAVALLVVGVALAAWQWRAAQPRSAEPLTKSGARSDGLVEEPSVEDSDDTAVEQALRQLPGFDEKVDKNRWVSKIPQLDVSDLTPARYDVFIRFANARRCTCGCGYTLAGCRIYDSSCEVSGPLVTALLDSVRRGLLVSAAGVREAPVAAAAVTGRR